jgi:ABC-2 type transport system permease protein
VAKAGARLRSVYEMYIPFFINSIQSTLAYKVNFFVFSFGGIIWVFVPYFLWKAIYASGGDNVIAGFTLMDMQQYVFISYIVHQLLETQVVHKVAEDIKNGSIAMSLIKPVNYRLMWFSQGMGTVVLRLFVIGLPILNYRKSYTGAQVLRWVHEEKLTG